MKGPKGVLAEAISKALAEYFVVDPAHIETNLITNAGLTLHDVQLRPQEQLIKPNPSDDNTTANTTTTTEDDNITARVYGSVSKVAFHWKWGSSSKQGGSSWVNSAELTIDGLKVTVSLTRGGSPEQQHQQEQADATKKTEAKKTNGNGGGGFQGYVREQVERIIDTLKLSITDFEFRVQLPPKDNMDGDTEKVIRNLCFGGAGLKLESYGRTTDTEPLRQQLDIANIFSNIEYVGENSDNVVVFPLLEPISYEAECVRVAGKRFEGGLQRGLQVRGESMDNGVIVHTGKEQVSFLNDLGGMLIVPSSSKGQEVDTQQPETKRSDLPNVDECDMYSSYFQLPLAGVSLVFPNGTKISMTDLEVKYQMDGHVCSVEGRKGFLVNDFPMLGLGVDGFWEANVVESKFRVFGKAKENKNAAYIHARDDEIQSVKNGVNDLLSIYQMLLSDNSGAVASLSTLDPQTPQAPSPDAPPPASSWTFDIDGDLDFLLEGPEKETMVDCRLSKINADVANKTLTIGSFQKLDIPGSMCLTHPLENARLQFDGDLLDIHLNDIVAKLQPPPASQKPENKAEEPLLSDDTQSMPASVNSPQSEASTPFILPFGIKAHVNSVKVYETDGETIHTTLKTIQAAIGPDSPKVENGKQIHEGGVRALLMLEEVNHDMISLTDTKVAAVIYPHDLSLVRECDFGANTIAVAAGYSVFDWKRLFETGDQKREKRKEKKSGDKSKKKTDIFLPFAHVQPLKVKIAVKGEVVGTKGTTLNIGEFNGKENTVLRDLIRFYTARVMTSMPGMFRDADVLGFNVTDTAASHVGTAAGAGMLGALGGAAAPVAGVLGIVGFDGVKHTINAGKKSRGVQEDDKMQFGDFFRGIGQAAKDTTASGAAKRGKAAQEKANALDWALGATSGAAQYTGDNKSRLGGAGAGTAGFAYGMVLGGPVGAIAGALIASSATSRTIDAIDTKVSKGKNKNLK